MAPPVVNHDLEVLDRLAAMRLICDAFLLGRWIPTEQGLASLTGLAAWATRHAWAANFAQRAT
jgi:hypothetical protein